VCLVTDGRCVLAEVSRVLGDRWPMCLGRSFSCAWWPMADVPWPLQGVSRVVGDRWPMCLGRSSRVLGDRWPMCVAPFRKFPVCWVTDGRCALAEVPRVCGDRWPMCIGRCVPVCLVTDGQCALAEVSRVLGDRWPMCLGRNFLWSQLECDTPQRFLGASRSPVATGLDLGMLGRGWPVGEAQEHQGE